MIPIHDLIDKVQDIRVVKLSALTHYDATEPHRHNYFEIFIFDRGLGVHDIDFHPFEITSKSIHIVAPGQVHQVRRELDTNGYVILFDTSVIQSNPVVSNFLFDHMCYDVEELSPAYKFDDATGDQILSAANTIWKDYNSDNELKNEFLKNHLFLICISCLRTLEQKAVASTANSDIYRSFRRLLRNNFKEIKKVKDYAAALNITEKKLNEIVKSKSGMSCSGLIYKQLILEAKRLLNTDISSKEVAYELNFEDPAHFSKFFKSQTGYSPSQFQNVQA
ncbi:MAG: helix-turn-helix domain-containing protein [Crocinitomicaceae bacterium]|nr:helix-turn-helix domain-containing protein [Crocinitomicaceae bacterium]